jgi:hypothetical protein
MNVSINSESESVVRQYLATGLFATPEGVVNEAILRMKLSDVRERVMEPPLAYDESISIPDFPHGPGVIVKPVLSTKPRLPEILFDVDQD